MPQASINSRAVHSPPRIKTNQAACRWFAHSIDQANAEQKGRRMTKSIWTIEQFACPGCGIDYSATREEHRDKRSGSFNCSICETEVHRWSGYHEYFNWQGAPTRARVFGKKR
jgi:predicted SprT family Zn-dependent metalloprotease